MGLKITLSFDEIKRIRKTVMPNNYLENAKQWLILGCNIGQRVSDLLKLKKSNIAEVDGNKIIVLSQQKTKKQVAIPINKEAQYILDLNNGDFPRQISDMKFNKYLKMVCEEAQINEVINGSKVDPETKRKVVGKYTKWQLVSSHICRRSYATNYYSLYLLVSQDTAQKDNF